MFNSEVWATVQHYPWNPPCGVAGSSPGGGGCVEGAGQELEEAVRMSC